MCSLIGVTVYTRYERNVELNDNQPMCSLQSNTEQVRMPKTPSRPNYILYHSYLEREREREKRRPGGKEREYQALTSAYVDNKQITSGCIRFTQAFKS